MIAVGTFNFLHNIMNILYYIFLHIHMYVAISLEENEHSWVVCNDTDVRKKP